MLLLLKQVDEERVHGGLQLDFTRSILLCNLRIRLWILLRQHLLEELGLSCRLLHRLVDTLDDFVLLSGLFLAR